MTDPIALPESVKELQTFFVKAFEIVGYNEDESLSNANLMIIKVMHLAYLNYFDSHPKQKEEVDKLRQEDQSDQEFYQQNAQVIFEKINQKDYLLSIRLITQALTQEYFKSIAQNLNQEQIQKLNEHLKQYE